MTDTKVRKADFLFILHARVGKTDMKGTTIADVGHN
jgi:hypothetical protein